MSSKSSSEAILGLWWGFWLRAPGSEPGISPFMSDDAALPPSLPASLRRFLVASVAGTFGSEGGTAAPPNVILVQNFFEELRQVVPE